MERLTKTALRSEVLLLKALVGARGFAGGTFKGIEVPTSNISIAVVELNPGDHSYRELTAHCGS